MCRTIAVSALIWGANVDAFTPTKIGSRVLSSNDGRQTQISSSPRQPVFSLRMSTQSPPELNFYKILGVSRSADDAEIKKAYRRLAKLYHPDVNPEKDTTEQFQALNRAYEVLSDPGLKKNYDMFGGRGIGTSAASDVEVGERVKQREKRRRPDMTDYYDSDEFFGSVGTRGNKRYNSGPVGFDTFSTGTWDGPGSEEDFASRWGSTGADSRKRHRRSPHVNEEEVDFDWFGGTSKKDGSRYRPYGPIIGDDLALDYEVDFKTAVLGGPIEVTLHRFEKCDPCTGTGARPGTKKSTCATCGGSGVSIPVNSRSGPVFSIACPDCRGTGEKIDNPCSSCFGTAIRQKSTTIKVDIPAGIMDGNKLRVQGQGDVGPHAGPSGDLFLFLKVKQDPTFRREGSDIFSDVVISCLDAIVGTKMTVPVIDGEATVEIPPGTQPGHVICVKKRGAPSLIAEERGDHFITVEVAIPNGNKDKDDKLVQLLTSTKDSGGATPSPKNEVKKPTSSDVLSPHNFSAPFPKITTKGSDDSKSPSPATTNASVPFPTTSTKGEGTKVPAGETVNASVPFPTASTTQPASPKVEAVASSSSTVIDNDTLSSLKVQAAKAEEEKKQRLKFEKLLAEREQEIKDQAKKLQELQARALRESEQRIHFEKLAAERETELQESARRQEEMNKDITIRVRQAHGQTTRITIKKSMEMSRIFDMVARQRGVRVADMKFSYDGKDVTPDETPFSLDMEMNSIIDVTMTRRSGGVGTGVRYM